MDDVLQEDGKVLQAERGTLQGVALQKQIKNRFNQIEEVLPGKEKKKPYQGMILRGAYRSFSP